MAVIHGKGALGYIGIEQDFLAFRKYQRLLKLVL